MSMVAGGLILLLVVWGCVQFALVFVYGARSYPSGARGTTTGTAWWRRLGGEDETFEVYFLIPCLDEEAVIGATVRAALDQSRTATVVVIDDGSEDGTSAAARVAGGHRAVVCRRELPCARQGKGAALNAGYAIVRDDVRRRRLDPYRVLVVVMDADGRLSPGAVDSVIEQFRDPRVGGVQLPVRIRNRDTLLGQVQDFEFWGVAALAQVARMRSRSVSLGGNGQFTRLAALEPLGAHPWSDALTEDLDLTVTLLAEGWWLSSAPDSHVSQQGVERLRPLIRQRTRWFQGHIGCALRIPELWRSDRLPTLGFVEATSYLLAPLVLVLPWSVLFTWGLVQTSLFVLGELGAVLGGASPSRLVAVAGWYLVSFAPMLLAAFAYHRRSDAGMARSVGLAHLAVAAGYVTFVATWRALVRTLLGRRSWAKTARHQEPSTRPVPVPVPVPADAA